MLAPYLHKDLIEAGLDEAGRGCYAGPVFAAAVILPKDFFHPLLNDSKQLKEKDRDLLRPIIEKESIAFAVAAVDNDEIDKINILQASYKAMHLSLDKMKTIPQSLNIRSLILENFEQAVLTKDSAEKNTLINFVLVGGGPTGVELAGALAEMKKEILQKDYPDLNIDRMEPPSCEGKSYRMRNESASFKKGNFCRVSSSIDFSRVMVNTSSRSGM